MTNSGIRGKRSKDSLGKLTLLDKFYQAQFPIPTITSFEISGSDDLALDPAGGQTVILRGKNFESGSTVIVGGETIGAVTFLDTTRLSFSSPTKTSGSYNVFVVNPNGGTAILTPGLVYSGLPTFTTAAGSLGSYYETTEISELIEATEGADTITYALISGSLPTNSNLLANGLIVGTAPVESNATTYTFTIQATDEEQQDAVREFSITINADIVTWSSPEAGTVELTGDELMSNITLSASSAAGYAVTYQANTLPNGVTLDSGVVNGTPTDEETVYTLFTATAATTNRSATREIVFVVSLGDAFFKDTVLLLNGDVNTFISDASDNSLTLTPSGDVRPSAFSPYNTNWSNYFDGSTDYLTVPNTDSVFSFGTGDFTIEAWVYLLSKTGRNTLWGGAQNGSFDIQLTVPDGSGAIGVGKSNVGYNVLASYNFPLNQWVHVAVARSGSSLRVFANGALLTTATNTENYIVQGSYATVGVSNPANAVEHAINGYVSNIRAIKGTAVYTSAFTPPTAPLTAIANTSLLTCQSNRFVDNSTNNFAITRNGDVKVTSFGPFADTDTTTGSGYFDGTSDNLSLADNAATLSAFNGTVAMTFEAWVYPMNTSWVLATAQTTSSGQFWWELYHSAADGFTMTFGFWGSSSAQAKTGSSQLIPTNQWTHVVWQRRSDNTVEIFFNGVSQTVTNGYYGSYVGAQLNGPGVAKLGGGGYYTDEPIYISNFRFTKDRVYTSNFTPPTAPLTAIANTSLLTLQNRISYNNSQPVDESGVKNIITRNGNASVGTFSPFVPSGWSGYFDGTGNTSTFKSLATPESSSFDLINGNNTVEGWIFPTGRSAESLPFQKATIFAFRSSSIGGAAKYYFMYITTTGYLGIAEDINSSYSENISTTFIQLDTWTHIAWVRSSGTNKFYVNGADITGTFSNPNLGEWPGPSANYACYIGVSPYLYGAYTYLGPFIGYISNFRVVKGTAVYTEAFTPSTAPLTAISGTSLLTCQSNRFVDNSANNFAITVNGNTAIQPFSPFKSHTITPNSYSVYFDGSGDYLTVPNSAGLNFDTGDYTVEAWIYSSAYTAYQILFDNRVSSAVGIGVYVGGQSTDTNTLNVASNTGVMGGGGTLLPNQWIHVAVIRNSGTISLYINGNSVSSFLDTRTYASSSAAYVGANTGGTQPFAGYISNLRVIKGTALYTSSFTPPTTPLTAIANTSLLTCQSPTVVDNSANSFTITANGNSRPTKFNPFGETVTTGIAYSSATHGGSVYFDGNGDYLLTADSSGFNLTPSTFTVEGWYYIDKASPTAPHFFQISYSGARVNVYQSGSVLSLYSSIGGGGNSTHTVRQNEWFHLALSVNAGVATLYLNGVGYTYGSFSIFDSNATRVCIGYQDRAGASNDYFPGYVSNFRFVKGTAVYTSNFTPSTTPLTAIAGTTLLINGTNAAIQDRTGRTVLETVGNARNVSESPYRLNKSVYFDGTGDYLTVPSNSALAMGTGDFTVECFIYTQSSSSTSFMIVDTRNADDDVNGFVFYRRTTGKLTFGYWSGGFQSIESNTTINANTWYHVMFTRSSNTGRLFVNGTLDSSAVSVTSNFSRQTNFRIGASWSDTNSCFGYISNLRIVKGTAVYTSNFTPPTAPLTAIANTSLLTCQSYNFKDNSTNNFTITRSGDAKITSFGPFTETNPTNNCMYFDGSGDYITLSPSESFNFGTGNFTIEFWMNATTVDSTYRRIVTNNSGGFDSTTVVARLSNANVFQCYVGSTPFNGSSTISAGTWYHVALVRSGSTCTLYLNGVSDASATSTASVSKTSMFVGGFYTAGPSEFYHGYIDDLRITKGVARYTSNFTPPTSTHQLK